MGRSGQMERPFQPRKVLHLERWTGFFETFPAGPIHSVEDRNFRKFWLIGSRPLKKKLRSTKGGNDFKVKQVKNNGDSVKGSSQYSHYDRCLHAL